MAGYAELIVQYSLSVPAPDYLCAIGTKHKMHQNGHWRIFTPRHKPKSSLFDHLTFALKYEGVDLGVLKALFGEIQPETIIEIVQARPTSAYSRRIWFLYEWLLNTELDLDSATKGNYIPLLNDAIQYAGPVRNSKRHRVRNNLPGTREYCPLVRRTEKLDRFIQMDLSHAARTQLNATSKNLLDRATAFLLLEDSRASYAIEGESPPHNRIERWGKIIGEAGQQKLTIEMLGELQKVVLADNRFVFHGYRIEGGFIGEHDRVTGFPIPAHVSARAEDLDSLLSGLVETYRLLLESDYNPVLMSALIAFGFVFIHPFEDGNGRIHRYLIHHVLGESEFVAKEFVFPVSAIILSRIDRYKKVLEHYSKPRLDLIEWRPTPKNNIEVLGDTIDLYRYFDATVQAEFLFECVAETVDKILPEEIDYLQKYDLLSEFIKNYIGLPDKSISLLIRFLDQNNGKLSKRARSKEFIQLTDGEIQLIESKFHEIFRGDI